MLEERLVRAEAMLDIIALEARHARAWGSGDGNAWAGVFTKDGIFEIAAVGDRPALRVEGRDQLSAFCLEAARAPNSSISEGSASFFKYQVSCTPG